MAQQLIAINGNEEFPYTLTPDDISEAMGLQPGISSGGLNTSGAIETTSLLNSSGEVELGNSAWNNVVQISNETNNVTIPNSNPINALIEFYPSTIVSPSVDSKWTLNLNEGQYFFSPNTGITNNTTTSIEINYIDSIYILSKGNGEMDIIGGTYLFNNNLFGYNQGSSNAIYRTLFSRLRQNVSLLDFGADKTGSNLSTDAINYAAIYSALTGAEIECPAGQYLCNGELSSSANAIISLPDATGSTPFNNNQVIIKFRGETTPTCYPEMTNNVVPTYGTQFITTDSAGTSGEVVPALIGCPPSSDSSYSFQPMTFMMSNILLRLPVSSELGALQLQYCGNVILENVTCDVDSPTNLETQPTSATNIGIYLPKNNNFGRVHAKGIYIFGYNTGMIGTSHARVQAFMQSCVNGYIQNDGNHTSKLDLMLQGCVHNLIIAGTNPPTLDVLLDIEHDTYFPYTDDILIQQENTNVAGRIAYSITPITPITVNAPSSVNFFAKTFDLRTNTNVTFITSNFNIDYIGQDRFYEINGSDSYTINLPSSSNAKTFKASFLNNTSVVQNLRIDGAGYFYYLSTQYTSFPLIPGSLYNIKSDGYNYWVYSSVLQENNKSLNNISNVGDVTVSSTELLAKYYNNFAVQTSDFNVTTDTAVNILAAIPTAYVGSSFVFRLINNDQSAEGYKATLVAGDGISINTTIPNLPIYKGEWGDYLFVFTEVGDTPTLTCSLIGVGSISENVYTTTESSTSGSVVTTMPNQGFSKKVVVYFDQYINDTSTSQSINFPTSFKYQPTLVTNETGLTITLSTSDYTVTSPNSNTSYSGVAIIEGI